MQQPSDAFMDLSKRAPKWTTLSQVVSGCLESGVNSQESLYIVAIWMLDNGCEAHGREILRGIESNTSVIGTYALAALQAIEAG
jgi:hypothetical protein